MNACCIFTRRPLNVIALDIQHGRWQFAAEYTDVVWNGGWFTITHYATPTQIPLTAIK